MYLCNILVSYKLHYEAIVSNNHLVFYFDI